MEDGKDDNLAKFIGHRVNLQVEEEMLDFKTEIRRELESNREDNHMQIEHHFREFHHKKWVNFRYTDSHYWNPHRAGPEGDMLYDPTLEGQYQRPEMNHLHNYPDAKAMNSDLEGI